MTKQELEEKIAKGESVWAITNKPIMLNFKKINKKDIHLEDDRLEIDTYYGELSSDIYEFKEIFNTRTEAEHYLHHANITRTETLPFLTWEEFRYTLNLCFTDNTGEKWDLYHNEGFIYIQAMYGYHGEKTRSPQNVGELTEENFYKAYDECVKLFKGEESK